MTSATGTCSKTHPSVTCTYSLRESTELNIFSVNDFVWKGLTFKSGLIDCRTEIKFQTKKYYVVYGNRTQR